MLMLALGDSITFGYGATDPQRSYPQMLRQHFARNQRVSLHVQAKPGWTSRQLNKSLADVPACIFDEAELVTLMIGGNDLLKSAPFLIQGKPERIAQVCERVQTEVEEIVGRANRPYNTFAIATLYNPFPNFDLAEQITLQFNDMIRRVAIRNKLRIVEVENLFRGNEATFVEHYRNGQFRDIRIVRNPIHPTDDGHRALYLGFAKALQKPMISRQRRKISRQKRRA